MGCIFSRLAAKFAFFPPSPPTYVLNRREEDGNVVVAPSPDSSTRRFPPHGEDFDVWVVDTKRGNKIVIFYLRNPLARLTLLYSHGNATDLGQLYDLFLQLKLNLRVNIMGYDYSGYGASTGEASEWNTYADIEAAYECLEREYGVSQEDIILYGQSVGSGPTLHLAARLPRLRAVILHSGILSGLRVLCHERLNCCCDIYENVKKIRKVKCHVLVIHGTEDEVVNWAHGHRIWRMAREAYEPLWVKGGGHCNLELYPDYIRHLSAFVIHMEKMTTKVRLHAIRQRLTHRDTPPPSCCSCTSSCTSSCTGTSCTVCTCTSSCCTGRCCTGSCCGSAIDDIIWGLCCCFKVGRWGCRKCSCGWQTWQKCKCNSCSSCVSIPSWSCMHMNFSTQWLCCCCCCVLAGERGSVVVG